MLKKYHRSIWCWAVYYSVLMPLKITRTTPISFEILKVMLRIKLEKSV